MIIRVFHPTDHGGHVPHREGAVGRAPQVHEQSEGQVPDIPVLPQTGETLRGQQVSEGAGGRAVRLSV